MWRRPSWTSSLRADGRSPTVVNSLKTRAEARVGRTSNPQGVSGSAVQRTGR